MKSTELRIGNYVGFKNDFNTVVGITDSGTVTIFTKNNAPLRDISDLEPIILNDHILKCCGFLNNGIEWVLNNFSLYGVDEGYSIISVSLARDGSPRVYYLHQLQNLYYVLNGVELTIKFEEKNKFIW